MPALDDVADAQASWSETANHGKRSTDIARNTSFGLSVGGSLLAAIASQLPNGPARLAIAVTGAILLGGVSFLAARLLSIEKLGRWTRTRATAEALKREAFKFASEAAPYDDPATRDRLLSAEQARIEEDVDDLLALESVRFCWNRGGFPRGAECD